MKERLILERDQIFKAHNEKGFLKLRDNQFPMATQGIVHEPLSNAIDQQQDNEPIEITLEKEENSCFYRLTYKDNGSGLTYENLEALHWIGKSTKRNQKEKFIGRFGMGLVGAFHTANGVTKIELESKVCGVPSRIIYDCETDGIPTWTREDLGRDCKGLQITFWIPERSIPQVKGTLESLIKKMGIPVVYNGKQYQWNPTDSVKQDSSDVVVVEKDSDIEIYYSAHPGSDDSFSSIDDIQIYLRGMPVEEGEMYRVLVSPLGDKMPQNFKVYGRPYIKDESCIIFSRKGEPTVGRDKLVRDAVFGEIRTRVEKTRVQALSKLLQKSLTVGIEPRYWEYSQNMALANIHSLQSPIQSHLKGECLASDKQFLLPFIEELLDYPMFPVFDSESLLSLREIVDANPPGGVYFYTESLEASSSLEGYHQCPFVLREQSVRFNPLWGGYEKGSIKDCLKPVLEALKAEVLDLNKLMYDEEKLEELEKKGVIKRSPTRVKYVENPSEEVTAFLSSLRSTLNRPWFRRALSPFRPPKRIYLRPIEVIEGEKNLIAGILGAEQNDFAIGINIDSHVIQNLKVHETGHLVFLPILCHELAHRRRSVVEETDASVPHSVRFYFDRIRLEDRVLSSCVRDLIGKEEEFSAEMEEGEVLVL